LLESKAVERGISEKTRESHLQSLSDLRSFVANNNLSLTKETARDYVSSCYERALKALSIMNRTSALGGFFKFLPRDRVIGVDLMQGIEPPAKERRLPGLQVRLCVSGPGRPAQFICSSDGTAHCVTVPNVTH
jgi:site-specific recombinase XerD